MPKGNNKTEGVSGGKFEIKRDSKKLSRENEKREIRDETEALDEKQDGSAD